MPHVVMTTHWTGGDIYPFIRIGRRLKQRGHAVTLLTHCAYREAAEQAGIAFAAIDTPEEWAGFVAEDMPRRANLLNTLRTVASAAPDTPPNDDADSYYHKLRREYLLVKEHCRAPDSVLLARHSSSIAALLVAEERHIPLVSVFMAPAMLSEVALTESMRDDSLLANVNGMRARLGFPPIQSWAAWINAARYNIGLWPEWFAAPDPRWTVQAEAVGFPLEAQVAADLGDVPPELQELLRGAERPILISGGTGKILRSDFYHLCIEACRILGWPAIVTTQHPELLPAPLPERVSWFRYLPFEQLMPLMGAIIHHGGIGTISQAMIAGIPQLVLAHGLDRPDNAFRLKSLGLAEAPPLMKWKPALIAEALARLRSPEIHQRCSLFAQRLRSADPLTRAAEVVERAAAAPDAAVARSNFVAPSSDTQVAAPPVAPIERLAQPAPDHAAGKLSNLSPEQLAVLMRRLHQKKARDG